MYQKQLYIGSVGWRQCFIGSSKRGPEGVGKPGRHAEGPWTREQVAQLAGHLG